MPLAKDQPLVQLTLQLRQQYQTLDSMVDSMNRTSEVEIEPITQQLTAIQATEEALRPMRETFRKEHDRLPPELEEPNNQTIELLKGLMPKLAQLEKATLDSAKRLFPKIQESVRAVQMQNAYRRVS